jgi:glycosyltransferase domain-containing protein
MKVGIFIPTCNRPKFLQRALTYYGRKSELLRETIFHIYDASSPEIININKREVESHELNINHVEYKDQPNEYQRFLDSSRNIEEEYILQVGDDDFIIPESLKATQIFLDSNENYVACSGMRMSFILDSPDENKVKGKNIVPTRTIPGPYWPMDNPIGRFKTYMRTGIPMQHFLTRRETYRDIYAHLETMMDGVPLLTQDLLPCALLSISGNIKRIDYILSFLRQESDLSTYKYIDEIMTYPNFSETLVKAKELLVTKMSNLVGKEEAQFTVDREFIVRFICLLQWVKDVKYGRGNDENVFLQEQDKLKFIPGTEAYYKQILRDIYEVSKK